MKTTHTFPDMLFRATIVGTLIVAMTGASVLPLQAQNPPPNTATDRVPLSESDLREMLGPIALYPDALIALILPAATVPSDVVLGARFVQNNTDPAQAQNQPWDDSVKSLAYYPDVLLWMDENLEWTAALGEAFIDQPADVMNVMQALRAQARANGTLVDTPEQSVVVQDEVIEIIPTNPEIIYVPQYDPGVVFVDSWSSGWVAPVIGFGIGFGVGSWLNYGCDWGRRGIYCGTWAGWGGGYYNGGYYGGGGNRANISNNDVNVNRNVNISGNTVNRNNVNVSGNRVANIKNTKAWKASDRSIRQINQRKQNGGNARYTSIKNSGNKAGSKTNGAKLAAARNNALPKPDKISVKDRGINQPNSTKKSALKNSLPPKSSATNNSAGNNAGRKSAGTGLVPPPSVTTARPSAAPKVSKPVNFDRSNQKATAQAPRNSSSTSSSNKTSTSNKSSSSLKSKATATYDRTKTAPKAQAAPSRAPSVQKNSSSLRQTLSNRSNSSSTQKSTQVAQPQTRKQSIQQPTYNRAPSRPSTLPQARPSSSTPQQRLTVPQNRSSSSSSSSSSLRQRAAQAQSNASSSRQESRSSALQNFRSSSGNSSSFSGSSSGNNRSGNNRSDDTGKGRGWRNR